MMLCRSRFGSLRRRTATQRKHQQNQRERQEIGENRPRLHAAEQNRTPETRLTAKKNSVHASVTWRV